MKVMISSDTLQFINRVNKSNPLILMTHDAEKTGAPLIALSIAREFKKMNENFIVISLGNGDLIKDFEECADVFIFSYGEIPYMLESIKVCGTIFLNTIISGSLSLYFKNKGYKTVTLIHEMGRFINQNNWEGFAERVIQGSDKIIMPSKVVADSWKDIGFSIPDNVLRICSQGNYQKKTELSKKECREIVLREFNLPENSKIVISASAFIEKNKGIDAFIDTLIMLLKQRKDIYFIWFGKDAFSVLQNHNIQSKLEIVGEHCIFPGFKDDLSVYMKSADIFFLPSLSDSFPTVVLQAVDVGIPVVFCGKCSGCSDFYKDFDAGMIDEYSVLKFQDEIQKLVDDEDLWKRVNQQELEFSKTYYSPNEYARKLLEYF